MLIIKRNEPQHPEQRHWLRLPLHTPELACYLLRSFQLHCISPFCLLVPGGGGGSGILCVIRCSSVGSSAFRTPPFACGIQVAASCSFDHPGLLRRTGSINRVCVSHGDPVLFWELFGGFESRWSLFRMLFSFRDSGWRIIRLTERTVTWD